MQKQQKHLSPKTALIVGASRGLGFDMVEEYLKRGWHVIATARAGSADKLRHIAGVSNGMLEVETVDITDAEQVSLLRNRFPARQIDLLFVNAGIATHDMVADISTDEFIRMMVTNALSPMRVVENLRERVSPTGTIGIMSSGQGSIANNNNGNYEIYRASKTALNMLMKSYAARHAGDAATFLLMAPGWVRTDLGGPEARLSIEESIPSLVNTIEAYQEKSGLHYLDYLGRVVPW